MERDEIIGQIIEKIRAYGKIIVMRHTRPDGDAIGAQMGIALMLRRAFPEKDIRIINGDSSENFAFIEQEDAPVPDEFYADALGIVLDTAVTKRISNPKFALCKELIKIDHHVDVSPYGNIYWVDESASSCCQMLAELCLLRPDVFVPDAQAATCIYTGMVTDSGRFKYSEVNGDTLRCAAAMLDCGIDTELLFANLDLAGLDYLKFKAYIYNHIKMTPNGVAYIYVDKKMQEKFALSGEQASSAVSFLSEIRGSLMWIAFIDNEDGSIRSRLRSRFMNVIELAQIYHGGGHDKASGATVYSRREMNALLKDADELIRVYKEGNQGWL